MSWAKIFWPRCCLLEPYFVALCDIWKEHLCLFSLFLMFFQCFQQAVLGLLCYFLQRVLAIDSWVTSMLNSNSHLWQFLKNQTKPTKQVILADNLIRTILSFWNKSTIVSIYVYIPFILWLVFKLWLGIEKSIKIFGLLTLWSSTTNIFVFNYFSVDSWCL